MRWIILTFLLSAILPLSFVEAAPDLRGFMTKITGEYDAVRDRRFAGFAAVSKLENGDWLTESEINLAGEERSITENTFRIEGDQLLKVESDSQGQVVVRKMQIVLLTESNLKFIDLYSLHEGSVYNWLVRRDGIVMMNSSRWLQVQTGDYREVHPFSSMKLTRVK